MIERPDGRTNNDLRPLTIQRNFTHNAPGSVLVSYGDTKVLVTASIEERVPRHVYHLGDDNGWLTAEYSLLPGSTNTRTNRERYKLSGRTSEIQRLIGRSLRAAIDLSRLGQRTITIDADVIQADGGTRVASITGGYVALMDALKHLYDGGLLNEIPLISPVASVSVGIIEGHVCLDLNYQEDLAATVDANVVMNGDGNIIEFQATAEGEPYTREQMIELLDVAHGGIKEIIALQQQALEETVSV